MKSRKHLTIFLQGVAVITPALLTVYICFKAIWWLDSTVRGGLARVTSVSVPGIGAVVALVAIYMVGLLTRNWLFQKLVGFGEAVVNRIPLVKSIYSAIKDMLQLVGGGEAASRGTAARLTLLDGKVHMLGIVTQKRPESLIGDAEEGRVGVYLPMSLQIGGFTVYVPHESVEELPDMDVETVMKLSMTAGVSSPQAAKPAEGTGAAATPPLAQ